MANDRTVAIYPSGATSPGGYDATYTSWDAMENAEDGDLTNASGSNTRLLVEITASDGSWSAVDSAQGMDGWKTDKGTDGSCVEVYTLANSRSADGKWSASAYTLEPSWSVGRLVDNDATADSYLDVQFKQVQIQGRSGGDYAASVYTGAYHGEVGFIGCHFRAVNALTDDLLWIRDQNATTVTRVKNCIFDCNSNAYEALEITDTTGTCYVYNNTAFGGLTSGTENGFDGGNSDNITYKNNAVFNFPDNDFGNIGAIATVDYNASDDDYGTNSVDISPTVPADESGDWHAAFTDPDGSPPDVSVKDTDSVLYAAGVGSGTDSEVPTDDIIGTARGSDSVCIGAYEYAGAEVSNLTINVSDSLSCIQTLD